MKNKLRLLILSLAFGAALLFGATQVAAQSPVTVEPGTLYTDQGGTLTIYASGTLTFTNKHTVRLVGHGILPTSYSNPTALQATVPAGLAAGDYALRVLDENGVAVGAGSVKLVNRPATPAPPDAPPAGQPILTIRNSSINPVQVRPGQEFVVTIEVYNNGSRAAENTLVLFPGGTFLPVGENGHLVGQVHINHTFTLSQRMRVPQEVSNGVQTLQVNIAANDWSGSTYNFSQPVSVEVIGASSGAPATGKPRLVIENAVTTPEVIAPGAPFSLTLQLSNRGNRSATNIMVGADPTLVIPTQGGNLTPAGNLRINETLTVTLSLLLKPGKDGGRQGLLVTLECGDYSGGGYSEQQTIGIMVDTSLANRPQLLVEGYHTFPEMISPGDNFSLTLTISNVGGGEAQRLTLALGGEEGEQLGAFVPLDGSNLSFIPRIGAGETEYVVVQLMAAGNAETRAHNLPVALAYDTGGGTREKSTQRISLLVYRRPQFKVSFYRPVEGTAMMGQPFPLPIELVNTGAARFNIPTFEVTGEGVEFLGESSTFVGNLDPGGSWTLDATAMAFAPGPLELTVNIHYIDDRNQTQIMSQTLTVDVMEGWMPENGEGGENGGGMPMPQPETWWQQVLRFIKGLVGFGS